MVRSGSLTVGLWTCRAQVCSLARGSLQSGSKFRFGRFGAEMLFCPFFHTLSTDILILIMWPGMHPHWRGSLLQSTSSPLKCSVDKRLSCCPHFPGCSGCSFLSPRCKKKFSDHTSGASSLLLFCDSGYFVF